MSLFDKLMAVDDSKVREKKTKTVHSERLSKLLGIETSITIEALPFRLVRKYLDSAMKDNGRMDSDRHVDSMCHLIRLSVKEIPWGDPELQRKFGASDPKDLVEKMLDSDIGKISDEVVVISGYGDDAEESEAELEENVKN